MKITLVENTTNKVERIFLNSMTVLCENSLQELESNFWYSDSTKEEFIQNVKVLYDRLRKKGIKELYTEKTTCKYCFPNSPAYNFFDLKTGEFTFRYIILQVNQNEFRIEECKNVLLPERNDGLPF